MRLGTFASSPEIRWATLGSWPQSRSSRSSEVPRSRQSWGWSPTPVLCQNSVRRSNGRSLRLQTECGRRDERRPRARTAASAPRRTSPVGCTEPEVGTMGKWLARVRKHASCLESAPIRTFNGAACGEDGRPRFAAAFHDVYENFHHIVERAGQNTDSGERSTLEAPAQRHRWRRRNSPHLVAAVSGVVRKLPPRISLDRAAGRAAWLRASPRMRPLP